MLRQLNERKEWDFIIIGGGATGLGIAVDAAGRGFSTLLLEQSDFAKGTSSRSTKLVHGGVRYLAQGDIRLVYSALRERGLLMHNAAHVVKWQSFIIPCYSNMERLKYSVGLKFYDLLSRSHRFQSSRFLSSATVRKKFPNIKSAGLRGGVEYVDGQFDDARLAINLAQTAIEHQASVLNYVAVKGLIKQNMRVTGVEATDLESGRDYVLYAKAVINATGVFVDDVLKMDNPDRPPLVRPSQGVHIVLDKRFLPGSNALMIPETTDGRVLFAVPWQGHLLVGTTDTPIDSYSLEPRALDKEVDFILETIQSYLTDSPTRKDVLSVFAGLRPLAAPTDESEATKEISRDHKLMVGDSGLITITGGKWTTYRKMAEETVDAAVKSAALPTADCTTREMLIHGRPEIVSETHLSLYGTDEENIHQLIKDKSVLAKPLSAGHSYCLAEVVWAVNHEMARTIEDVLARRLRLLFLDARAAIEAAPVVGEIMMQELGYDVLWKKKQIAEFTELASQYV
ncbi:MAG TPA: glycerol-3-phosphate dehydrogenase/oxidase [Flavitalea sp.]|nr:glycerol-3-phosphate dehydrogenase/oxidase [Flavitalea sp.]